jgi:hypothetical protein
MTGVSETFSPIIGCAMPERRIRIQADIIAGSARSPIFVNQRE